MNRKRVTAVVMTLCMVFVTGIGAGEVIVETESFNERYSLDGGRSFHPLDAKGEAELFAILRTNVQSAEELKKYDAAYTGAFLCAIAGGFGIGWPLGSMAAGNPWSTTDTIFLGVGVAGIIGVFVLNGMAENHLKQAVAFYNGEITSYLYSPRHQWAAGFGAGAFLAGVQYKF